MDDDVDGFVNAVFNDRVLSEKTDNLSNHLLGFLMEDHLLALVGLVNVDIELHELDISMELLSGCTIGGLLSSD